MDDDYFTILSPPPVTVTEEEIENRYNYVMPSRNDAKVYMKSIIDTINTFMQALILIDSINSINIYMIEDAIESLHKDLKLNLKYNIYYKFDRASAKIIKAYLADAVRAIAELLINKPDPESLFDDSMLEKVMDSITPIHQIDVSNADRTWSSRMDMARRKTSRRKRF